jgi:hypothetical protein
MTYAINGKQYVAVLIGSHAVAALVGIGEAVKSGIGVPGHPHCSVRQSNRG